MQNYALRIKSQYCIPILPVDMNNKEDIPWIKLLLDTQKSYKKAILFFYDLQYILWKLIYNHSRKIFVGN